MTPAATLGAYAAVLALVFGAAVGVGNAVGPVGTVAEADGGEAGAPPHGTADGAIHGAHAPAPQTAADAPPVPGGLSVAQDGYVLELDRTTAEPGRTPLSFTVSGPDGQPLTDYTRTHDKDLHLIVVRRDLTGYQHVHPERDADGRWTVPVTLAEPGPYKVFADFTPAGRERPLTLAADLTVPGDYAPRPLPAATEHASVDGYDVELDGRLVAGTSSEVTLTVSRDGEPVTDLEPYLGAYGHLVALRAGDLAYLHVHPDGALDDPATRPGPELPFTAEVPSPAAYRLFLDFSHGGDVHTAELTAVAAGTQDAASDGPSGDAASGDAGEHSH